MEAIRDFISRFFETVPKDNAEFSVQFSTEVNRQYYKINELSSSNISTFWTEYMEAVEKYLESVREGGIDEYFDITRYLKEHVPIFVQFTIKTKEDCSNDISDGKFIPILVAICQKAIMDNLNVNDKTHLDSIVAVTVENDGNENDKIDGYYMQNIRIHFPKISSTTNRLRNIKSSIIDYTSKHSVLRFLSNDAIDFHNSIVIYGTEKTEIPLYPSCTYKEHICRPVEAYADYYGLIDIDEFIELADTNTFDIESYVVSKNAFNVAEHNAIKGMQIISVEKFGEIRTIEELSFYMPFVLNGNYQSVVHMPKITAEELGIKKIDNSEDSKHARYIQELLKYISYDYKKYHYLIRICDAIYNEFKKRDQDIGFKIWENLINDIAMNAKNAHELFDEMKTDDQSIRKYYYENNHSDYYTIRTIKFLARVSNMADYETFVFKRIIEIIRQSNPPAKKNVSDKLMSDIILEYYSDIVFTSYNTKKWFIYDYKNKNHHLSSSPDKDRCQHIITKYMLQDMKDLLERVKRDEYNIGAEVEVVKNRLNAIINRIESRDISTSLAYAKSYFNRENIESSLDVNLSVIGCENGVFDIIQESVSDVNVIKFRIGLPEDLITRYAPTIYKRYSYDDEEIQNVDKYMMQLMGYSYEMKEYLMAIMASCLRGNSLKYFVIMTGETDAGKSTFKKLLEATLGYGMVHTINNSVVTSTNPVKSGNANDELAKSIGARYIATQETNARMQKLSNNSIKNLTGGDTQQVRTLYSEGFNATQTGTLMLFCNDIPTFDLMDNAVVNRLCIFQFKSRFIEGAPKNEEEQKKRNHYPIDREFDKKLSKLTKPFLWLLINKLRQIIKHGGGRPDMPSYMKECVKHYVRQTDHHKRFIEEHMEYVEDEEERYQVPQIKMSQIVAKFRSWKLQEDRDFKFNSTTDTNSLIEHFGKHNVINVKNIDYVINYRYRED